MGRIRRSKIWKEKKNTQNIIPPEINTLSSLVHDSVHVKNIIQFAVQNGISSIEIVLSDYG